MYIKIALAPKTKARNIRGSKIFHAFLLFFLFYSLKEPTSNEEGSPIFKKQCLHFFLSLEWHSHSSGGKINNDVLDFVSLYLYDICVITVALIHIQVFVFGVQEYVNDLASCTEQCLFILFLLALHRTEFLPKWGCFREH